MRSDCICHIHYCPVLFVPPLSLLNKGGVDNFCVCMFASQILQAKYLLCLVSLCRYVTDTKRIPQVLLMSDGIDMDKRSPYEVDDDAVVATVHQHDGQSAVVPLMGYSRGHTDDPSAAGGGQVTSQLQRRIIKGLEKSLLQNVQEGKKFKVALEWSSFDGVFPVDATVCLGGEVISILEVDGPHHYRHDGKLRRKDMLKEAM